MATTPDQKFADFVHGLLQAGVDPATIAGAMGRDPSKMPPPPTAKPNLSAALEAAVRQKALDAAYGGGGGGGGAAGAPGGQLKPPPGGQYIPQYMIHDEVEMPQRTFYGFPVRVEPAIRADVVMYVQDGILHIPSELSDPVIREMIKGKQWPPNAVELRNLQAGFLAEDTRADTVIECTACDETNFRTCAHCGGNGFITKVA